MARVVHKVTKEYRPSVNTPEYDPNDWMINPDMSAVIGSGFETQLWYWKLDLVNNAVLIMTPAERATQDALMVDTYRDGVASELDQLESGFRALAMILMDELNTLRALHGLAPRTSAQLKAALRAKLGNN